MQPSHANMARRQCLSSFTLSSSRSPASAKPRGSKRPPGVTESSSSGKGFSKRRSHCALRRADEEDLDGEDGPEGGVSGAFGGEGSDGAGELVGDGSAVVGGAEGTRGEPGDAGAVLGGPGARSHEPPAAAVDDLALGVLVVIEGNDGGLAAAGVDAELRVKVRGGGGAELGDLLVIGGVRGAVSVWLEKSPPEPPRRDRVRLRPLDTKKACRYRQTR